MTDHLLSLYESDIEAMRVDDRAEIQILRAIAEAIKLLVDDDEWADHNPISNRNAIQNILRLWEKR